MRTPMRAALRLALTGWLGLAGVSLLASGALAAAPPEKALPDSVILFAKASNAASFREAFKQSQLGQLWNDPAMKPFRDDVASRLGDGSKNLKEKLGVTIKELIAMPQGPVSLAVLPKEEGEFPAAVVLTVDVGKNADKLTEVLTRATQQGEQSGAKVSKEEFKGLTFQIITPPKPKEAKEGDRPPLPVVWTHDRSVFFIGTDIDALKDVVANAGGRETSLAANDIYTQATKKLASDAQGVWFVDIGKLLNLVAKAGAKGKNAANIEQFKAMSQVLGINGLKAAAGSFAMNSGSFDTISKTFVLAPAPLQGILKIFPMPKVNLRPEPWVPASVASYQTFSWNLDEAFTNLNDLANMFQPGVLNVLEQQLVGPNGGEPLNFKKDVFDPLGDRITVIGDFKKPISEDSQRMLIAVALEDAKAFENTLTKLIALAGGAPKKREFQGTTIYDFDLPDLPNANGRNVQLKGPISVTIAKNTLFLTSDPTLLEQVLRGGGPALADSATFQAVAKEIPSQTSSLTYVRPEESARLSYEMIKSGQFEKALQGAAVAGGPDVSKLGKLFDKDKLPEFSVFAKYLSPGGGYSLMDDDGITITNFTLRKTNP
jgi:hypothetical protein